MREIRKVVWGYTAGSFRTTFEEIIIRLTCPHLAIGSPPALYMLNLRLYTAYP